MPQGFLQRVAVLAFAALAGACGGAELDLKLATLPCAPRALPPLDGVSELRVTVYGPGVVPVPTRVPLAALSLELPDVLAGKARNVVIEGLQGDLVVSRGESGPIDLDTDQPVSTTVFVRRLDGFTPTGSPDGTCTQLDEERAGHTATLLANGRVLIAGGFREQDGRKVFLSSTEIYDPATGMFRRGPDLKVRRANHTATAVPKTSLVVIAGGEFENESGKAVRLAEVYDSSTNSLRSVQMLVGRVGHGAAASVVNGRVILVGGFDNQGAPLRSTEIYRQDLTAFVPGPELPSPRGGATAQVLVNGSIFVAGGWDGVTLVKRCVLFVPDADGTYSRADMDLLLNTARLYPLVGSLDPWRIVVGGGFTQGATPVLTAATASLELARLDNVEVAEKGISSMKRGQSGVVQLPNGTLLVSGGASSDGVKITAQTSAEIVAPSDNGLIVRPVGTALRDARFQAAHVLLSDGTALVVGGATVGTTGRTTYLKSAEIYQPNYQTSSASPYR